MKKYLSLILALSMILMLISCGKTQVSQNIDSSMPSKAEKPEVLTKTMVGNETIGVVLDIGIYDNFDEKFALDLMQSKYGENISKGGCTCVVKDRKDEGKGLLIGRNMDFSLSDRPLYKYVLNYNKYKAIGLTYSSFSGPTADVAMNGLTKNEEVIKFTKFLPVVGTDFLNEKGLYIETDMRNMDYGTDPTTNFIDTKYGCTGTNPGKGLPNVCLMSVPFYCSTRCATVDEVLDLIKNDINIYNKTTTEAQFKEAGKIGMDWNYSFVVADATGKYGLIEIAQNEIHFTPNVGQTNFYRDDDFAKIEDYPTGGWGKIKATNYKSCEMENTEGAYCDGKKCRYNVATQDLDKVKTVEDMQQNMRKVFYSQTYTNKSLGINSAINNSEVSNFNPRYEMVQNFPLVKTGDGENDWEMDLKNGNEYLATFETITKMSEEKFNALLKEYCTYYYAGKTKAKMLSDNADYWITSQSLVIDIDNREWTCQFFEGDETIKFGFN